MKNAENRILRNRPTQITLAAMAALTAIASGCGQQAYNDTSSSAGTSSTTVSTGTVNTPGNPGTTTTTTTNGSANYQFHFQMTGSGAATQVGGGSMSVTTDSTLKITVTAGDGLALQGTGYTIGFNCEQFTVKVGNVTQTAFVKKSGYYDWMLHYGYMSYDPCDSAQTSVTFDFSGALSPGHKTLPISVSNAQYDNCRLFSDPYDGGCVKSVVYSTHSVDGYLAVFTD